MCPATFEKLQHQDNLVIVIIVNFNGKMLPQKLTFTRYQFFYCVDSMAIILSDGHIYLVSIIGHSQRDAPGGGGGPLPRIFSPKVVEFSPNILSWSKIYKVGQKYIKLVKNI